MSQPAAGTKREAPPPAADEDGPPPEKRQSIGPRIYSVTVLLPIDAVGLIIGKGGAVFKALNEETGAKVRVQEYADVAKGSKQRGVTITGTVDAIEAAERIILDHLKQRRVTQDVSKAADREEGAAEEAGARHTARWLIPAEMSGLLIGKRGIGIMSINQDSGAFVKVAHEQELPPGASDKLVYITGTEEQNAKALELIKAKVGGKPVEQDADDYVFVNVRAVGYLLGKGGSELKNLSETSGARVQLSTAAELEMGSVDIKVRLYGNEEQIAKVKVLIRDRVELWHKEQPSRPASASSDPDMVETSIKMSIPASAVSGLIGKGGVGVREVNSKSGASVKVLADQPSHDSRVEQRPILLTGHLRAVFKAQQLLLERLMTLPVSAREPARKLTPAPAPAAAPTHVVKGAGLLDASVTGGHPSLLQPSFQSGGGGLYSQPGLLGDYRPT